MLDINATAIAVVINFLILVGVLNYFLYDPIRKILKERKEHVDMTLSQADAKMAGARAFFEEGKSSIDKANHNAREIIEQAKDASDKIKNDQIASTLKVIEEMQVRADEEIARARTQAEKSLIEEAAKLSVIMAEKLIKQNISASAQKALIDDYIKEVSVARN